MEAPELSYKLEGLEAENKMLKLLLKSCLDDCQSKMETIGPVNRLQIESILERQLDLVV